MSNEPLLRVELGQVCAQLRSSTLASDRLDDVVRAVAMVDGIVFFVELRSVVTDCGRADDIECPTLRRAHEQGFPVADVRRWRLHQRHHGGLHGVLRLIGEPAPTQDGGGDPEHRVAMPQIQGRPVWLPGAHPDTPDDASSLRPVIHRPLPPPPDVVRACLVN